MGIDNIGTTHGGQLTLEPLVTGGCSVEDFLRHLFIQWSTTVFYPITKSAESGAECEGAAS